VVDRSAASRNPLGPQTDNGAMEHGDAETAKTATEVAAIIAQPVNRRRRGKYLVGLCPSHEKSPLFTSNSSGTPVDFSGQIARDRLP
jgi:hypothetical protein